MTKLSAVLVVMGLAVARGAIQGLVPSVSPQATVAIVRQTHDVDPSGSYKWEIELENGIKAEEQGAVQPTGQEEGELKAQGSFSWTSPEGEQIQASYIADENGYQPQGSHIPTPPPIPALILKALEWNAAHPEPEEGHSLVAAKHV